MHGKLGPLYFWRGHPEQCRQWQIHSLQRGEPASRCRPPLRLDLLYQLDHPISDLRSKSWDEFAVQGAPDLDFVFTVCDDAAAEACPVWPGQPMSAHWGVPDPVRAQGTEAEKRLAFADAYRMLNNRISAFINLPISSLDRLSLKNKLDAIGKL